MISIASQLSQAVEKEELSDNVITSLHGCVSASKHILDTIRLAVKYWDNTAQMCSQIREAKKLVGDDLEDMKGWSLEDQLVMYNDPAFMETMARYLGKWQAMAVFSSEFKGHLEGPLLHLRHALTLNPTPEQGREALTQLAPKLERLSIKEKAFVTQQKSDAIEANRIQEELTLDVDNSWYIFVKYLKLILENGPATHNGIVEMNSCVFSMW